jgi:hypothetical protein
MLKEIDEDFVKKVNRPLDKSVIRQDNDHNDYITAYTVTRMLNELTNGAWSWTISDRWQDEITDKAGKKHTICHLLGTLTLMFAGPNGQVVEVKKQGVAGKEMYKNSKNAANIWKSLESLALRKAASYAGVGAELWLNDDEMGYFDSANVVWTDELIDKYKSVWDSIKDSCVKLKINDDELDVLANSWSAEVRSVLQIEPEKLPDFAKWLADLIKEQEPKEK